MRFLCSGGTRDGIWLRFRKIRSQKPHRILSFFTMLAAAGICNLAFHGGRLFHFPGLTRNIKHLKDIMERTGAGNLELGIRGKSRDEVDYLGKNL